MFFGKAFSFITWCIVQLLLYSDFSGNITKQVQNNFLVWIHFKNRCSSRSPPGSSYVKFAGSREHPKAVIAVHGLENSLYKKQAFTARGRAVQTILYKLNFSIENGRYQQCRSWWCVLQRRFWNCAKPYDRSFSKIGEN